MKKPQILSTVFYLIAALSNIAFVILILTLGFSVPVILLFVFGNVFLVFAKVIENRRKNKTPEPPSEKTE